MNEQPASRPQQRRGFDPQLLFGISLLGGLLLAWPSLSSAMQGNTDIFAAGIRLLLSIAFVWAGGFMLTKLIGGYAATAAEISETESSNTNQLPQPVANEIGNRGGNPTGNAIASAALPAGPEN